MNIKLWPIALALIIGWTSGLLFGMAFGPAPNYTPEMLWKAGIVIDGEGQLRAKNMHIILDGSDRDHPASTIKTREEGIVEEAKP